MFYPNSGSYRTVGASPLSEATEELNPSNVIIGNSNGRFVYNRKLYFKSVMLIIIIFLVYC